MFWEIPMMSYSHSSSAFDQRELIHDPSALGRNDQSSKPRHAADRAIDAALRSVPLPDGLMMRLRKLVYAMPDETADQVDCLGC
jgi:hypothetical protein